MTRSLAVAALHAFLFAFAVVFIALVVTGCAKPPADYWGSLARGLADQEK